MLSQISLVILLVGCGVENFQSKPGFNFSQSSTLNDPGDAAANTEKVAQLTLEVLRTAIQIKTKSFPGKRIPDDIFELWVKVDKYHAALKGIPQDIVYQGRLSAVLQLNSDARHFVQQKLLEITFPKVSEIYIGTSMHLMTFLIPIIFSPEEAFEIMRNFKIPEGSVRYDGVTGTVEFLDPLVKENTNKITFVMAFYNRRERTFLDLFHGLSKDQQTYLSVDTNTEDPRSRIEPIDLIASQQKARLLQSFELQSNPFRINILVLKSFLSVSLRHRLGVFVSDSELKEFGLVVFRNKDAGNPVQMLFCYSNSFTEEINGESTKYDGVDNYSIFYVFFNSFWPSKTANYQCGKLSYEAKLELNPASSTKTDIPEVQIDGTLRAISTISLLSEMNAQLRTLALLYLNAKGYTLSQIRMVADLKSDFVSAAASADVLIPVAHSLSMDHFLLGTTEAYKINAKKTVLNYITGKPTQIEFTAYFPPAANTDVKVSSQTLNVAEMSKLLLNRSQTKKNSLIVLNTSCFSEGMLNTWMYAWKTAVRTSSGQKIIPPIVIGSKKGFDTNNSYSILSHLEYPLNTLEELARGGKAKDVIEVLKLPPQKTSVILNAVEKINQYYEKFYGIKLVPVKFDKGFEPVINIDYPQYFDGSDEKIMILSNRDDGTDIKHF